MIRELRFSDMPRQLLPGGLAGEDWAYTRAALVAGARQLSQIDLLRWSVAGSRCRRALASIENGRLAGLALLQPRRGPRAWEVAHLFTSPGGLQRAAELLDRCVTCAAEGGGERLFLRVNCDCPMEGVARRAGFSPVYTEELFGLDAPMHADSHGSALPMRPVRSSDTHGLFRLYNAAVPVNARTMLGVTMDQWNDALEEPAGHSREYVWESEQQLRAWVRLSYRGQALEVDSLLHPDHGAKAPSLCASVARAAWPHRSAAWRVPSYQPELSRALQQKGWELIQTYAVLARSAANRVREPALMPVRA